MPEYISSAFEKKATRMTLPWRIPFPVWALTVCLLFAAVGVAVLDDYGVATDEIIQRAIGHQTVNTFLGREDALSKGKERFYSNVFEGFLALAERLLGLDDSRSVYLARHLLTHLFFLVGGFFCSLLAYRLFDSRLLALFALVLFLLHPRLYGHSFVNSKDIPFLVMFMLSLHFVHRPFRRDTIGAFLLCGAAVGLLTNLRIMGVMLFAAVLAMRACDFFQASEPRERKRLRTTGVAFLIAGALTLYATSPWLWRNPFEFVMGLAILSRHPTRTVSLFQGEPISWPEIPPHYIPVWIAITTPPVTLLLSLAGAASVLRSLWDRPRHALRNTDLRFALLLVACAASTVLAIVVLGSNIYNGWRHVYFLYAPLWPAGRVRPSMAGFRWRAAHAAEGCVRGCRGGGGRCRGRNDLHPSLPSGLFQLPGGPPYARTPAQPVQHGVLGDRLPGRAGTPAPAPSLFPRVRGRVEAAWQPCGQEPEDPSSSGPAKDRLRWKVGGTVA